MPIWARCLEITEAEGRGVCNRVCDLATPVATRRYADVSPSSGNTG